MITAKKCSLFTAVMVTVLSVNGWAKCPTDSVEIRGQLRCTFRQDDKILVTLMFKKNQLAGSAEETALDIHKDSFEGSINFNTLTSYNPVTGHKCDRRPTSVLVRFVNAQGEEWDRKTLRLPDDFSYDENEGRYKLRSSIVLQGWCKP